MKSILCFIFCTYFAMASSLIEEGGEKNSKSQNVNCIATAQKPFHMPSTLGDMIIARKKEKRRMEKISSHKKN